MTTNTSEKDFQNHIVNHLTSTGYIKRTNEKCCIGRGLVAVKFNNSKYLYYVLHLIEKPLNIISSGSTFEAISVDQLKSITVPYTKNETDQTVIAFFLDKVTAKIDKTIQKIEEKIKFLEEYKKSLIHHTVTGKIDIRGLEY